MGSPMSALPGSDRRSCFPAHLKKWSRDHIAFLLLFAAVAAIRLMILWSAQNHVHADEAIIGLMAKHVLQDGSRPVYFYGQPFNGGAALEAYVAAPLFCLFGPGVKPLKLTIVLLSLSAWILFYALVRRYWNQRVAWMASVFFALAPTLLPWHFQVRGGYGEYHLFMLGILYCTFSLAENEFRDPRHYILLGLVAGIALWCFELILPFLVLCLAYLAAVNRNAVSDRRFLLTLCFGLAGYSPALSYNLTHQWANWRFLIQQKLGAGKGIAGLFDPHTWAEILTHDLPRFFGPDTVLWYKPEVHTSGLVFYCIALVALSHALWSNRKTRIEFPACPLDKQGRDWRAFREMLIILLIFSCLLPYALVPKRVPGYLIGVVPLISILEACAAEHLLRRPRTVLRFAGTALIFVVAAFGLKDSLTFMLTDKIESLKLTHQGNLAPTHYSGRNLSRTIEHLKQRDIKTVLASPSLQYPIIFESDETIIASSSPLPFSYVVYPAYDRAVTSSIKARPVFVVEADSPLRAHAFSIIRGMTPGTITSTEFDEIVVIESETSPSP